MNWIEIVTCAIAAFFGGYEVIKLLLTRKSEKKKASAEADKAVIEAQEAKYNGINDEYQRIIDAYKQELEKLHEQLAFAQEHMKGKTEMIEELQQKMTDLVKEHQEQIIIKQSKIESLMDDINNLTSENTALAMVKCLKYNCLDRIPPYGSAGIDIKNGRIVSEQEVKEMMSEE